MTRLVWVALAALAVTGCHAYHRGDPVHASRRSKHKQVGRGPSWAPTPPASPAALTQRPRTL